MQDFKPPRHFTEIGFKRVRRADRNCINRERRAEIIKIVLSGGY